MLVPELIPLIAFKILVIVFASVFDVEPGYSARIVTIFSFSDSDKLFDSIVS